MQRTRLAWLVMCGLLIVSLSPVVAAGPAQVDQPSAQAAQGKERHPAIHAAIRHLEQAKAALEKAQHDFGGHRTRAVEHVNQALEECRAALEYDKK
jgi:hypothetical protein